jgi:DNA-binding NarL/FixJ family response regulator
MQGKKYFSQKVMAKMMDKMSAFGAGDGPSIDLLSDRELEVLDLIGGGFGSRQIAERLHLSIKTVESHREHIKSKLALGSATELTKYAYNWAHRKDRL